MFWRSATLETNTQKLIVYHIKGIVIGRGSDVLWETPHPLGWDTIDKACDRAHDLFDDMGWLSSWVTRTGPILQIKEKWGRVVVYAEPGPEQMKKFLDILAQLIEEFPGLQDYMDISSAPPLTVAKGDEAEEVSCNRNLTDEELLELARRFPENKESLGTIEEEEEKKEGDRRVLNST